MSAAPTHQRESRRITVSPTSSRGMEGRLCERTFSSSARVRRLTPGNPLDVAADRGTLLDGGPLPAERRVNGCPQIAPGDRNAVARPAVVELTAVDQHAIAVEEEKVRRACGGIR